MPRPAGPIPAVFGYHELFHALVSRRPRANTRPSPWSSPARSCDAAAAGPIWSGGRARVDESLRRDAHPLLLELLVLADAPRDMAHLGLLLGKDERDAGAVPSGASRAPHPVRVAGVVGRRIEVDHVRDVVEVEAAGRDIGRNERRDCPPRTGRGPFAAALVHVSVHRDGLDLVAPKSVDEPVGASLGRTKT